MNNQYIRAQQGAIVKYNANKFEMTATSTGNGTGVSTLRLTTNSDTVITINGNGLFYDDVAGTLNPSSSKLLTAGGAMTFYLKVTLGSCKIEIANGKTKVTRFDSFDSYTNAASLSFNLSSIPSVMTFFSCGGANTITGNLSSIPSVMTFFNCGGANTITGNLSSIPSVMTFFNCGGANTITEYTSRNFAKNMQRVYLRSNTSINLSASNNDQLLMDLNNAGGTWSGDKLINLKGTRTTASDAAVASLIAKGVSVIVN